MWLGDSDERFKSSLHHCTILYNYKSFWLILYHIFNAIEHVYIIILSIPYLHGIPSYYFHWHPISSLPPCPGSEWIMHAKSGYTAYRVPVAQAASYYDVQIQVRLDQPGGPWWTMVDHGGPHGIASMWCVERYEITINHHILGNKHPLTSYSRVPVPGFWLIAMYSIVFHRQVHHWSEHDMSRWS